MKLYHFLSEKYGLESLKYQRIKVSHLDNLNDPFELYATKLTDHKLRSKFHSLERLIIDEFGILCLSKQWRSPLLWSHYADRHKGVALEIEVADKRVKHVRYQNKRLEPNWSNFITLFGDIHNIQNKLLITKYAQWSYEEEARVFLSKEEIYRKGNLSFFDYNDDCKLTGIISGPLCKLRDIDIKRILPTGKCVKFTKARLAFGSYNVVRNKNYKPRIVK